MSTPNQTEMKLFGDMSIEERLEKSKHLRIVCVATPNYGHMFPMSRIAIALQEKGHEVHVVTVDNERGRNGIPKLFDGTDVQLHMTPGMEMDIIMTDIGKDNIDPKDKFVNAWEEGCMAKIKDLKPDIVVADMLARPGFYAATALGVPAVLNMPAGPFSLYQFASLEKQPNLHKQAQNRCGKLVISQTPIQYLIQWSLSNYLVMRPQDQEFRKTWNNYTTLYQSFWGLEEAQAIPPNIVLTGPFLKPAADYMKLFEEKDKELFDWVNKAQEENIPVVYITLGTECVWQEWAIKELYNGLKAVNCRVVWALKPPFTLPEENKNFVVKAWTPQIELLNHPGVKACLTHCGMGGTSETIAAGVPVITWPHFGDQQPNSECLIRNKVGIALTNKIRVSKKIAENITFKDPIFDAAKITEVFNEILNNPMYRKNMQRLRLIQMTTGGSELAATTIEKEYLNGGNAHLRDDIGLQKYKKMNCCTACCWSCFNFIVYVALIYFTIMYFVITNDEAYAIKMITQKV